MISQQQEIKQQFLRQHPALIEGKVPGCGHFALKLILFLRTVLLLRVLACLGRGGDLGDWRRGWKQRTSRTLWCWHGQWAFWWRKTRAWRVEER